VSGGSRGWCGGDWKKKVGEKNKSKWITIRQS